MPSGCRWIILWAHWQADVLKGPERQPRCINEDNQVSCWFLLQQPGKGLLGRRVIPTVVNLWGGTLWKSFDWIPLNVLVFCMRMFCLRLEFLSDVDVNVWPLAHPKQQKEFSRASWCPGLSDPLVLGESGVTQMVCQGAVAFCLSLSSASDVMFCILWMHWVALHILKTRFPSFLLNFPLGACFSCSQQDLPSQ